MGMAQFFSAKLCDRVGKIVHKEAGTGRQPLKDSVLAGENDIAIEIQ